MERQKADVQTRRRWWPIHRHARQWTIRAHGEGRIAMGIAAPSAAVAGRPVATAASDIAASPPAPATGPPVAAQPAAGSASDGTILVISDDRPAAAAIRRCLEQDGYHVVVSAGGVDALA